MLVGNTSSFHFPGAAGFKGPCKPCLSRGHRSQNSPREPGLVETWRAMLPPACGWGTLLSAAQVRAWGGPIVLPCRGSPYSAVGRGPEQSGAGKCKGWAVRRLEFSLTSACLPKIKPWILTHLRGLGLRFPNCKEKAMVAAFSLWQ